jgi:hypothetical protein
VTSSPAVREDRTVSLLAELLARGLDARPGTGVHANAITVRTSGSKSAFLRSAKLDRTIEVTNPRSGFYVLRFAAPVPTT